MIRFLFLLTLCAGCSRTQLNPVGVKLPFDIPGKRRLFMGPVTFHGVTFNVEIPRNQRDKAIRILPTGVIKVGEETVVRAHPQRHFFFKAGGGPWVLFRKGSRVFVFRPEESGEVSLHFHSLHVVLSGKAGRRVAVALRDTERGKELRFGFAEIYFREGEFYLADGQRLSSLGRRSGVKLTLGGEITYL